MRARGARAEQSAHDAAPARAPGGMAVHRGPPDVDQRQGPRWRGGGGERFATRGAPIARGAGDLPLPIIAQMPPTRVLRAHRPLPPSAPALRSSTASTSSCRPQMRPRHRRASPPSLCCDGSASSGSYTTRRVRAGNVGGRGLGAGRPVRAALLRPLRARRGSVTWGGRQAACTVWPRGARPPTRPPTLCPLCPPCPPRDEQLKASDPDAMRERAHPQ